MAKEGKTSNTYRYTARISVPPPTARSGKRLTFLGRLFIRASVLLVSISHLPPLGESSDSFDFRPVLLSPHERRTSGRVRVILLWLVRQAPGKKRPARRRTGKPTRAVGAIV